MDIFEQQDYFPTAIIAQVSTINQQPAGKVQTPHSSTPFLDLNRSPRSLSIPSTSTLTQRPATAQPSHHPMCLPLPSLPNRQKREYPVPPKPFSNAVSSWTYVPKPGPPGVSAALGQHGKASKASQAGRVSGGMRAGKPVGARSHKGGGFIESDFAAKKEQGSYRPDTVATAMDYEST